jgi:hypothetical protein
VTKSWIHIADDWTQEEREEMVKYLLGDNHASTIKILRDKGYTSVRGLF